MLGAVEAGAQFGVEAAALEGGEVGVGIEYLLDIVAGADEAIAGGEWAADLRFGHDYPILALVSYLGLDGVSKRLSFDQVDSEWYGWENLCMGSNLQMIFYRNDAGVVLVKFLYNEHEKTVQGLKPYQGCYYRWDDIKADPAGYRRY